MECPECGSRLTRRPVSICYSCDSVIYKGVVLEDTDVNPPYRATVYEDCGICGERTEPMFIFVEDRTILGGEPLIRCGHCRDKIDIIEGM